MHTNMNVEPAQRKRHRFFDDAEHKCSFCPMSFHNVVGRDDHEQYRHHRRDA